MAGNVTGFQRPYTFRANETFTTVGIDQAVVYSGKMREVEVPKEDNLIPVGIVSYQYEDRDGGTVAVQLDRIAQIEAVEPIAFGEEVIVAAGGKAKRAAGLTEGTVANILGEAQNSVNAGDKVQVLIRPRAKTV
ncbi:MULTISPECIES: hypothetical protein [Bacteria]|uniref:hypothetical protein n=1 Tax=Bacteria TaxID=2 RepID=UPI000466EBE4|nr:MULTISPECIES: hypothetical protein [Bacillus]MCY8196575.1 hypothetical protein [Bacillus spizizenii]MCY8219345.1 hypothetical protein [Bacillus spizizenii]MCY8362069.1 hypothetical protein [Bacillus spizizenii]MCZ4246897.1 hypothetical protein [Bacillus amyloliquefaciens]MDR4436176.1 hypothetical protein [Bacillus tequilensis]